MRSETSRLLFSAMSGLGIDMCSFSALTLLFQVSEKVATEFVALVWKSCPTLRIVTNDGDIQQDTGSGSKLEAYVAGASNDAVGGGGGIKKSARKMKMVPVPYWYEKPMRCVSSKV